MRKILALAVLGTLPVFSLAASLDVLPSIVKLAPDQKVSSLQVRNNTDTDASFEIKVVEEIGVDEALRRVPTSDIVASPPIFTVRPGGRQTVRFLVRKPNTGNSEVRYRLYAEQIPVAATAGEPGIRMLVNLGIPIFIAPANEQPSLAASTGDTGMRIRNNGNVTLHLLGLEAADCEDVKVNRYLRPDAVMEIPLPQQTAKACSYEAKLESGSLPLR